MRRRTLLSASLGLGSLTGLAYVGIQPGAATGLQSFTGSAKAFGTTVNIQVLHHAAASAHAAIAAALQQVKTVDALMSLHQPGSQVFQLNQQGWLDIPNPHLLQVLAYAQQLSGQTAGAFDITVQPLWQAFSRAQNQATLPTLQALAQAKALVNWQKLTFSHQQVRLAQPGMAITLNGLAQGYAADLALQALSAGGVAHALLDTGEFAALGDKAVGQPWVLGIRHPRQADVLAARVALDGRMLATSGDYETVFSPDHAHHHIFDPATGDSPTVLASATVLAPIGMMADGLSTAFMVMPPDQTLALAAQLPQVDVLLIAKDGSRRTTPHFPMLAT